MYPQWLPASVKSNAERKLFDLLRDYLPDEYIAIWSIDWTMPRPTAYGGGVHESEVDFLILHPIKGVLVLEVKGGGVGYDGTRHEWYTIDARNERYTIQDPFDQGRNSTHTLRRELTQRIPLAWLQMACRQSVFGMPLSSLISVKNVWRIAPHVPRSLCLIVRICNLALSYRQSSTLCLLDTNHNTAPGSTCS